jgi:hypothetical protein
MSETIADKPNREQCTILDAIQSGTPQIVAVSALAGTGKSTLLKQAALGPCSKLAIHYSVFNNQNAREAECEFPENTTVATANAYAYNSKHPDYPGTMRDVYGHGRLVQSLYSALRDQAQRPGEFANQVARVQESLHIPRGKAIMALQAVMREYLQDENTEIKSTHIPERLARQVQRRPDNGDFHPLLRLARLTWQEMRNPKGDFPVDHSAYLKLASLEPQPIDADILFFDEAQDATPAMLRIFEAQLRYGTRLVLVGDTFQRIYAYAGAVDAMARTMERFPDKTVMMPLSGSYRFGPEIADLANVLLRQMGSKQMLRGLGADGTISDGRGRMDCALFRTNAELLNAAILSVQAGRKIYVVGGTKDIVKLIEAMARLYRGEFSAHQDLAFFANWDELVEYVRTAGPGSATNFGPLVKLIKQYNGNVAPLVQALNSTESNHKLAEFSLCTAHKAKGGQWGRIFVGRDFAPYWEKIGEGKRPVVPERDELSLAYVTLTRARQAIFGGGLFASMRRNFQENGRLDLVARIDQALSQPESTGNLEPK